jgi:choline transport protein
MVGPTRPILLLPQDTMASPDKKTDEHDTVNSIATVEHEGETLVQPRFGFWALLGYQMMVMASWSNYLVTIGVSIDVGGPVGFLYGTLIVGFFQQLTVLALSELASVWPHPGGPLFWIVKLAPEGFGAACSFFMGWVSVLAYTSPMASAGFSSTQVVTAMITEIYGYEWTNWQLCFVYWGFALACVPVSLRPSWMPIWSLVSLVCLIVTLVVTIGLWASHIDPQTSTFVFTEFINNTGWGSNGLVFVLSLVQTTYAMSGLEAATHMSFETRDPKRTIPLVLVSSVAISTVLCFGFAVLLLYSLGPLDDLLNSSLGAIYLQLYVNAAGEAGGLAVATIIMILLNLFCGTQLLAAGARVLWALAKLGFVPFPKVFERLDPKTGAPRNATIFVLVFSLLLGLLYIASEVAWNAISSCVVGAFQAAYISPLIVLLVRGRSVLPARYFNLDRVPYLGYIVDILAIFWGLAIFIVSLFPVYIPVEAGTMNYCVVVFGVYTFILVPYWIFSARYKISHESLEANMDNYMQ